MRCSVERLRLVQGNKVQHICINFCMNRSRSPLPQLRTGKLHDNLSTPSQWAHPQALELEKNHKPRHIMCLNNNDNDMICQKWVWITSQISLFRDFDIFDRNTSEYDVTDPNYWKLLCIAQYQHGQVNTIYFVFHIRICMLMHWSLGPVGCSCWTQ